MKKYVLMISADMFEDTELLVPYYRLREEGADVTLASLRKGKITGKRGYEVTADIAFKDVRPEKYDALIVPGGKAPQAIRGDEHVINIVRHFFSSGKPVSAICHGPQVLISAGVMKGRHATCYKSVADELKAAGAKYEDSEVVIDGNLVTSRMPSDLPSFMRETMKKLRSQDLS